MFVHRSLIVGAALVSVVASAAHGFQGSSSQVTRAPAQDGTGVIINEHEISRTQLGALERLYGAAPPKGRYWYDARSGLY
jgi:hypothetical protein